MSDAPTTAAELLLRYTCAQRARRRAFIEWEVRRCREPGALDGGTHTLFAVRCLPARRSELGL
jgi:hypothetical protein